MLPILKGAIDSSQGQNKASTVTSVSDAEPGSFRNNEFFRFTCPYCDKSLCDSRISHYKKEHNFEDSPELLRILNGARTFEEMKGYPPRINRNSVRSWYC